MLKIGFVTQFFGEEWSLTTGQHLDGDDGEPVEPEADPAEDNNEGAGHIHLADDKDKGRPPVPNRLFF